MMEANMSSLSRSFARKGLVLLWTIASMSVSPVATAQHQTITRRVLSADIERGDQHFIIESALALGRMSLCMSVDPTGDVDRDFVALMMPHHQGALDMAHAELKYSHNEELRRLAREIIAEREHEISEMLRALGELAPAQSSDSPARECTTGSNPKRPSGAETKE
jgi:uncharacterized protein (DUF305 family)